MSVYGVDHILVAVENLESSKQTYENLGFTLSRRGRHIGWGTANYCVMFQGQGKRGDYIELLGIIDPAQFTNGLDERLAQEGEGFLGLAYACDDVDQVAEQLADANVPMQDAKDLKRILESDEGDTILSFRLLHPQPNVVPFPRSFFCQHLDRERVWKPELLAHPNTAIGLGDLRLPATDLRPIEKSLSSVFDCYNMGTFLTLDCAGAGRIIFDTRLEQAEQIIFVASLDVCQQALMKTKVPFQTVSNAIKVDPVHANGLAIRFLENPTSC